MGRSRRGHGRSGRLLPQYWWVAVAGGAAALRRDDVGALVAGKRADFVCLDAPSYVHLAYRPGVPLVHDVVLGGQLNPRLVGE